MNQRLLSLIFSSKSSFINDSFFKQLDLPLLLNSAKLSIFGDIYLWQNHTEKQKMKMVVISDEKGEGYN